MDRIREPAAATAQNLKPARRKLQKSDPKTKSVAFKRASQDSNASSVESGLRSVTRQMGAIGQPTSPFPPDLSDAKWLGYVEQNDLRSPISSPTQPSPLPSDASPSPAATPLIPELSHLAISDAPTRPPPEPPSSQPPNPRHSTTSAMRRQAKTPVFQIGQLEKSALRRRKAEAAAAANRAAAEETEAAVGQRCSVELIAEQYRALLEPRGVEDDESTHTTTPPLDTTSRENPLNISYGHNPESHNDPEVPHTSVLLELPPRSNQNGLSPTSDDGTLVDFEEDAIYFKPVSFGSPEPSPPPHRQSFDRKARSSSSTEYGSSLQISVDLLTRELSSTLGARPGHANRDASSLQVWVMIQAYERLREHVAGLGLDDDERQGIKAVFDSWLGALHKVYGSLADAAAASESEYEGLAEDVD